MAEPWGTAGSAGPSAVAEAQRGLWLHLHWVPLCHLLSRRTEGPRSQHIFHTSEQWNSFQIYACMYRCLLALCILLQILAFQLPREKTVHISLLLHKACNICDSWLHSETCIISYSEHINFCYSVQTLYAKSSLQHKRPILSPLFSRFG